MSFLVTFVFFAGLFLAMPWLVILFGRYCDAVNRLIARRNQRARKDGTVCSAYRVPVTSEGSGLCACCGMFDYKHQERADA